MLLRKVSGNSPAIGNLCLHHGYALDLAAQDHRQIVADICAGPIAEFLRTSGFEVKSYFVAESLSRRNPAGSTQISAGDDRGFFKNVVPRAFAASRYKTEPPGCQEKSRPPRPPLWMDTRSREARRRGSPVSHL